ncbi:MAG TPA: trypsin-like peptidase domain-containing protein [Solirubrobacteraceae bacterium]|nr:trypsin-like peptidase domain-containing protein [Solirubrobacteraceae bacterium]
MTRRSLTAGLVAGTLALGAGGGAGAATLLATDTPATTATATTPVGGATTRTASTTASGNLDVTAVYDQTKQGVVDIKATGTAQRGFGRPSQTTAQGTGFVIDKDGHIVTNQHVIDGAQSIEVTFADGTTATATVVGADASRDVAVLKVDVAADMLTPLTFAGSGSVEVGQDVVAIGNAYGFSETVTAGIVSALGREITAPDGSTISGAIQTDAAINSGNSGGPLLDADGQVVGVNAQIYSESGANSGVGFAIPAETVQQAVAGILGTGGSPV